MSECAIVIVNWNTKDLLFDCLKSVFECTRGISFEVWVVDNGSTDGSQDMVKKSFPQVKLVETNENLGFAKANNVAIRKTDTPYVILLNSDTKLTQDTFTSMMKFVKERKDVGVIGCKLLNRDGSNQPSAAPFYYIWVIFLMLFGFDRFLRRSFDVTREVDWVVGACMLVTRDAITKAGLLDEAFFMYVEEAEWCYRIKRAGYKVLYYPITSLYHLTRGSSTSGKKHAILNIYWGLQYWYTKHGSLFSLIFVRFLLLTKAVIALGIGFILRRKALIETYREAIGRIFSFRSFGRRLDDHV